MAPSNEPTSSIEPASSDSPQARSSRSQVDDVENLTKMLNAHLKLTKSKATKSPAGAIASSKSALVTRVALEIDDSSVLSKEEKKNAKNAIERFVTSTNLKLARRFIRHVQGKEWEKLKIEFVTFSRTTSNHMVKMRVNVLPPVPIAQIFHRKDSLSYFEQHRAMFHKIKPTEARLTDFIEVQYKEPYNLEVTAKYKMLSYFDLADRGKAKGKHRDLCWTILPELLLFELSATSTPSEVKTKLVSPQSHMNSTFLKGIADIVIISFVEKKKGSETSGSTIVKDERSREKIINKFCGEEATSTYQDAHRIAAELASAIEQLGTKEVKWEFLVLEVKRREPISGMKGPAAEQTATDANHEEDGGDDDPELNESNQVTAENEAIRPENISIMGREMSLQKDLGLRAHLPQVISECLAVETGSPPLGAHIIKFVLADGDNWIFGLVDCFRPGENGRMCYSTAVQVAPSDYENLPDQVLKVVEFLILWSSTPGRYLKTLFPKLNAETQSADNGKDEGDDSEENGEGDDEGEDDKEIGEVGADEGEDEDEEIGEENE